MGKNMHMNLKAIACAKHVDKALVFCNPFSDDNKALFGK